MPLFDTGDWFWCALGSPSLPSNAKDESVVNTGAHIWCKSSEEQIQYDSEWLINRR